MSEPATREQQVADVYRHMFAPRLDAYADWDAGAEHWTAVRSELTVDRIVEGLHDRNRPVSAYMETVEGETHVGAIDFDTDNGWDLGMRVAEVITSDGGLAAVEHSRRGCHLWVPIDMPMPSSVVRRALKAWVARVDERASRDPKVELLPKPIVSRGPDTLGFCLRMPMMAHQRTHKRSLLFRADAEPWGESVTDTLLSLAPRLTPTAVVGASAGKAKLAVSDIASPAWARRPEQESGDVISLLMAAGVPNAAPGRTVRCVLHDDSHASLSIARDSGRVFCKAPECEAYNGGRGLGADQLAKALAGRA